MYGEHLSGILHIDLPDSRPHFRVRYAQERKANIQQTRDSGRQMLHGFHSPLRF